MSYSIYYFLEVRYEFRPLWEYEYHLIRRMLYALLLSSEISAKGEIRTAMLCG